MSTKPIIRNQHLAGHNGAIFGLCPGPSSQIIYSSGGDGWIVEWDLTNPDPGRLVAKVDTQIYSLVYVAAIHGLVAGNMHGGVYWVDLDRHQETKGISHHQKGLFALTVDQNSLYSGGGDGLLTRWSIAERRTIESVQISQEALRCIAPNASSSRIAVGCSDSRIYILDSSSLQLIHIVEAAHQPSVFSAAWSPDGRFLWSGGRDAHLKCWDSMDDFKLVFDLAAHWYTINALAFNPEGTILASASRDKTIRLWDTATGALLQTLETVRDQGHRNSVNNLFWSSWQNTLVSASDDRTLILWYNS
jgi:WD40 repeat protein